jgi:hypothetical protein
MAYGRACTILAYWLTAVVAYIYTILAYWLTGLLAYCILAYWLTAAALAMRTMWEDLSCRGRILEKPRPWKVKMHTASCSGHIMEGTQLEDILCELCFTVVSPRCLI